MNPFKEYLQNRQKHLGLPLKKRLTPLKAASKYEYRK